MGIPFAKIEELIRVAKDCDERLREEEKRIHVKDIAATLQKLIDDELEYLDKMAQEFQEKEAEDDVVSSQYAMMREKMNKSDWPHGL